eukprot:scaffold30.g4456.t1
MRCRAETASCMPLRTAVGARPLHRQPARLLGGGGLQEQRQQQAWQRRQQPPAAAANDTASGAPEPAAATEPTVPANTFQGLKVAFYIALWYAFNIVFNLLNKSTLNLFPAPWFLATFQLAASAIFMGVLWLTRLQPLPQISKRMLVALLPVALFHTVGHMAVSFAHVVKAAEPVLSVVLAQAILGETYPYYVWLSLLPIIAGTSLSAMKEVSFAWGGFNNAMISNVGMVLRNIYSKKSLGDFKARAWRRRRRRLIDGINLFALLSIISFFYCLPCAWVLEGAKWPALWEAGVAAAGGAAPFWKLLAAGGASYMVLDQGISPVTFSVGNTMKRIAVVLSSVLFFRNPVSALNWVGSMVAMLGTGLYSLAKQRATEEARVAAAAAKAAGAAAQ